MQKESELVRIECEFSRNFKGKGTKPISMAAVPTPLMTPSKPAQLEEGHEMHPLVLGLLQKGVYPALVLLHPAE
jgi:hypothetical protein